jgi:hypothetical protein
VVAWGLWLLAKGCWYWLLAEFVLWLGGEGVLEVFIIPFVVVFEP